MTDFPREPQPRELAARPGPIATGERIVAIDVLRGVAVLGILVMNIYGFAMPYPAYTNPMHMGGTEWYNLGTWFVTHIFFDQKFMTIFSLLFGAGLIDMWQRAEVRQANFASVFFRRQGWLLAIGAIHAYLIWFGDILFSYALMGLFAYLFRQRKPGTLIVLALLMLSVAPLLSVTGGTYVAALRAQAENVSAANAAGVEVTAEQRKASAEWRALQSFFEPNEETLSQDLEAYRGNYSEILAWRVPQVVDMQTTGTLYYVFWRVGGLMLLGMALMKLGVLSGERSTVFYRKLLFIGYGIGLPVMLLSSTILYEARWNELFAFRIGSLPNYLGSLFVAMGHIALVMLIVRRNVITGLTKRLAAVGRMALTNYLMHSIVMTTIFYGYGLGLYGEIPRAAQMLFVAAMFSVQLMLSPIWLRAFRFGPAEWLWRSLTYGRLQPMRIEHARG